MGIDNWDVGLLVIKQIAFFVQSLYTGFVIGPIILLFIMWKRGYRCKASVDFYKKDDTE